MKLPLRPSFLLKIPYFQILFDLRYEGFAEEFTTYFNHNLETNPEDNLNLFKEFSQLKFRMEQLNVVHNLGVYYYRHQRQYWSRRPKNKIDFLKWESTFGHFLATSKDKPGTAVKMAPKWNRYTESYSEFFITELDVHTIVMEGLDMMLLSETVPSALLPAFALSIMIIYYEHKLEIEDFLEQEDPTNKII
ncbi:hypothetical protein [Litoribaculum gwangyangense]|uniref:Uncharacterized protein n=1 Tax=Litoribaculum gwangyangense TaxID=1130722 RepID=A0ABP9BX30_9FLAO